MEIECCLDKNNNNNKKWTTFLTSEMYTNETNMVKMVCQLDL